ncbi:MAG: BMP family ABC transporter substrate-binding protein [Candidatus Thorarchaeota archaeon]
MSSRSSIVASVIIVVVVFSAVGGFIFMTNPYVPAKIAVVVTEPGFGDLSMADQVLTGLHELGGDIVVDYEYFTAADIAEAQTILEDSSDNFDLIIVIGGELAGILDTVADLHPNQKYAFIGGEVIADNVYSTTFKLHEGAFLAGVLAARVSIGDENRTATSVVGIIASVETDPTIQAMIAGFKQGFYHANNTWNLTITLLPEQYVGSYNDSATAETLATEMFNPFGGAASIIFAPVRASMGGIRDAMLYANATWFGNNSAQPLVIAAEGDQDYLGLPNTQTRSGNSWIITSVVPRSDHAVYQVINSTLWGNFEGATLVYDLDDVTEPGDYEIIPGVTLTLSDYINYEWTPRVFFEDLLDIRQDIIDGIITVQDS